MGKPYPIEIVLSDDGSLHMEVWSPNTICFIREYSSLEELLNALLSLPIKDTDLFQVVDSAWKEETRKALDEIIPVIGDPPRSLPEKFMLFQQIHGKRDLFEFQVRVRKDFILADLWDYVRSLGEKFEADSYTEICAAYEKYGLPVPVKDYYGFDSFRDVGSWVLQKLIDSNDEIRKCAWCGRYFIPSRPSTQKCCSLACKQAQRDLADYCGESELARLAKAVKSIFDRKSNSDKKYKYQSPELDPNYDARFLFERANISITESFTKKEFARLRQAFFTENENRRHSFSSVHASYKANELSREDYLRHRDEYVGWLTNVHIQLKAFSSAKKQFEDLEYIDECISEKEDTTIEEFCAVPRTIKEITIFLGFNSPGYVKAKFLAPLLASGRLIIINPQRFQREPELFQVNFEP